MELRSATTKMCQTDAAAPYSRLISFGSVWSGRKSFHGQERIHSGPCIFLSPCCQPPHRSCWRSHSDLRDSSRGRMRLALTRRLDPSTVAIQHPTGHWASRHGQLCLRFKKPHGQRPRLQAPPDAGGRCPFHAKEHASPVSPPSPIGVGMGRRHV